MKELTITIVVFAAMFTLSCGGDGTQGRSSESMSASSQSSDRSSLSSRSMAEDQLAFEAVACPEVAVNSDFEEPQQEVIDNNHRFVEAYLGNQPYPHDEIPLVDFDESMVIFIHAGFKPTHRYGVEIDVVRETDDSVVVEYTEFEPGSDCLAEDEPTYPYCFISMDRTDKEISFQGSTVRQCNM